MSIVALGLSPILSALIAGEFLKLAAPPLYGLEDGSPRAQIFNRAVLTLGLFFAAFQAYGVTVALEAVQLPGGSAMIEDPDSFFRLSYMITLVAGVALTYWLAEIITRAGIGRGEGDIDLDKLRYHKIIIMTDADVDGAHIRTLLLTFFYRQMPEIIDGGFLYIAQPPLYKATKGKSGRYLKDQSEYETFLIEEGSAGAVLESASGAQYANDDLKRLAREAMAVEALIKRLHARTTDSVIEQAAIAGAFAAGAGDTEAKETARRLNAIAEEGEATWDGRFDPDGALVLERVVRGVAERATLDKLFLSSADARRLADRAENFLAVDEAFNLQLALARQLGAQMVGRQTVGDHLLAAREKRVRDDRAFEPHRPVATGRVGEASHLFQKLARAPAVVEKGGACARCKRSEHFVDRKAQNRRGNRPADHDEKRRHIEKDADRSAHRNREADNKQAGNDAADRGEVHPHRKNVSFELGSRQSRRDRVKGALPNCLQCFPRRAAGRPANGLVAAACEGVFKRSLR